MKISITVGIVPKLFPRHFGPKNISTNFREIFVNLPPKSYLDKFPSEENGETVTCSLWTMSGMFGEGVQNKKVGIYVTLFTLEINERWEGHEEAKELPDEEWVRALFLRRPPPPEPPSDPQRPPGPRSLPCRDICQNASLFAILLKCLPYTFIPLQHLYKYLPKYSMKICKNIALRAILSENVSECFHSIENVFIHSTKAFLQDIFCQHYFLWEHSSEILNQLLDREASLHEH